MSSADKKARAAALAALARSKREGTRMSATVNVEDVPMFVSREEAAASGGRAHDDDDYERTFVVDDDGLGYAEDEDADAAVGHVDDGDDARVASTGGSRAVKASRVLARMTDVRALQSGAAGRGGSSSSIAAAATSTAARHGSAISSDALESLLQEIDTAQAPEVNLNRRGVVAFPRYEAPPLVSLQDLEMREQALMASAPMDVDLNDAMEVDFNPPPQPAGTAAVGDAAPSAASKPRVRLAGGASTLAPSQLRAMAAKPLAETAAPPSLLAAAAGTASHTWIRAHGSGDGEAAAAAAPIAPGDVHLYTRVPAVKRNGFWRIPAAGAEAAADAAPAATTDIPTALFYWLDASEDRARGCVNMFGRILRNASDMASPSFTPVYASACVSVYGIERVLYICPRDKRASNGAPVSFTDVYAEVAALLRSHVHSSIKFGVKKVTRNYAFEEPGVPRTACDWLKVVYDCSLPPLDARVCAHGDTFSHVFGTTTPPLELLILKRDLMGPCWLRLCEPEHVASDMRISSCQYEMRVTSHKHIVRYTAAPEMPAPPLTVCTLAVKTVVHPRTHTHEIVCLSIVTHRSVAMDGPSDESLAHMSALTLIRPLSTAQPFPSDVRAVMGRMDPAARACISVEVNERALLNHAFAHMTSCDPDVICGHGITQFELDVLLKRADVHKSAASRLSRLKPSSAPRTRIGVQACTGRLICDTYLAAREHVRETTYTLTALSTALLSETRADVDVTDVHAYITGDRATGETVVALASHTQNDARLALRLMFTLQILPLSKQLTNLSGNLWSRSLRGARAERIEYLLLHEFHRCKYVCPDKVQYGSGGSSKGKGKEKEEGGDEDVLQMQLGLAGGAGGDDDDAAPDAGAMSTRGLTGTLARNSKKRAKAAYAGGLVLEPKRGLYDKYVLLLDFNSLYPSIIQEYNICFTTVERALTGGARAATADDAAAGGEDGAVAAHGDVPAVPDPHIHTQEGVLPRVIRVLVQRRRAVKSMMGAEKDAGKKAVLDIRQKALKILANSMYGCLGFTFSRFYARPIAALVTSQGREILTRTVALAQDVCGCEVVYGDTDSIMIYTAKTDIREVKAMGAAVKREVNKLYKKLEIEIDGIFACMLLLKKKKYAALVVHEAGGAITLTREMKGLDMVRRDWSQLSRDVGTRVLDIILSGRERDDIVEAIHANMRSVGNDVRGGVYPVERFIITRGINKHPSEYPDVRGQPHIQVALAMLRAGKHVNVGDVIPYVMCSQTRDVLTADAATSAAAAVSGASNKAQGVAAHAFHPDEVARSGGSLTLDYTWYLTHDVLQPVSRVCEPIAGVDTHTLAQALGLDASRYVSATAVAREEAYVPPSMSFEDRYASCTRVTAICTSCARVGDIAGVFRMQTGPDATGTVVDMAVSALTCSCGGGGIMMPVPTGSALLSHPPPTTAAAAIAHARTRITCAVTHILRTSAASYACAEWLCDCGAAYKVPTVTGTCMRVGCAGTLINSRMTAAQLYAQCMYFVTAFDLDAARERVTAAQAQPSAVPHAHRDVFDAAADAARAFLRRSAYAFVGADMFAYVNTVNSETGIGRNSKRGSAKARPAEARGHSRATLEGAETEGSAGSRKQKRLVF